MVSWDRFCLPKKMCVLGLRKTEAINKAFLCKFSWKYLAEPENFWVKVMRAGYPMTSDFFSRTYKSNDSWVWKCLLQNRELFRKGLRWKVGNGRSTKFWYDNWCGQKSLLEMLHLDEQDV